MFQMDPAATRSTLANADTTAAARPNAEARGPRLAAYMAPLLDAVSAVHGVRAAHVAARAATNSVSREVSVTAVETTEATNAATLSC